MTKIISHRLNTKEQAKNLSSECGAEIDLRLNYGRLVLAHDPFQDGYEFSDWLSIFRGSILVINVKEMGLEDMIMDNLRKINPHIDYFFLDQSIPYLIDSTTKGYKCAARVSEYETAESAFLQNTDWLWVDSFTGNWNHLVTIRHLQDKFHKKSICLVSPELHGRNVEIFEESRACFEQLNELGLELDAVCTKFPDVWRKVLE
jgi:hypothetical protein